MKHRAFSMLELMVVVAILGVVASMAVPNIQKSVGHYRAVGNAREVLAAVTSARGLAQRDNAPVQVSFAPKTVTIARADFSGGAAEVRKTVTGFSHDRVVNLPGDTKIVRLENLTTAGGVTSTVTLPGAASLRFCSTSDNYYRDNTPAANPLCGAGNLTSGNVRVVFTSEGETWNVRINAALGNIELKAGAT